MLTSGCVKHVIGMITAEYPIMQNEALLALALMADKILGKSGTLLYQMLLRLCLTAHTHTDQYVCSMFIFTINILSLYLFDVLGDLSSELCQQELLPALNVVLTEKETVAEVTLNSLTLLHLLTKSGKLSFQEHRPI